MERRVNFEPAEGKYPAIDKAKAANPARGWVWGAVDVFRNEDEIRIFMQEYTAFLQEVGVENLSQKAKDNMGMVLGHYSRKTQVLWRNAIPGLGTDVHDIVVRTRADMRAEGVSDQN